MITRLLVANRGEIARRVIRTCRSLGISPVAVHSDVDAAAPHVREADLAVRLPGAAAAQTYLRADLLLAAAGRTGADAVHPGYGFLSEDAGFARAVLDAGLVWVGPPPAAIAAMGSKVDAKRLVAAAGVPVLPTWWWEEVPADAPYPLLVKASYGGGGRGMRVVTDKSGLDGAVLAARREAESAFGDGTVFVEPYVERPRHVEVQVLADTHGTVLALGERECSIQRRHQKIVEEAPSPGSSGRAAGGAGRRGRRRGPGGRLPRRRDRRVSRHARGRAGLPGDEHPAAGRAPGHRGGARARPGRAAAGRRRGPRRSRPSPGRRDTRSRCGCTPRIRRPAGGRPPAPCTASRSRGWTRRSAGAGSGWTPGSRTAVPCRRTTTRCWRS